MILIVLLFQELENDRPMTAIKQEKTAADEQKNSTDLTSDSLGILWDKYINVIMFMRGR